MRNKSGIIFCLAIFLVFCALTGTIIGLNNTNTLEEVNTFEKDVLDNDKEVSVSHSVVHLVRDPHQIDGTAYAYVTIHPAGAQGQSIDSEKSNEPSINIALVLLISVLILGTAFVYVKLKNKETKRSTP